MERAEVGIPAVRQITGDSSLSTIAYPASYYKATGNSMGDMGEVFAQLVAATPVEFTADKTGGMVAPNFAITGISRAFGAVGGNIKDFSTGSFNPQLVFPDITLLGGITLKDIVPDFINATPETAGTQIPQLKTIQTTATFGDGEKPVLQTSYQWELPGSSLLTTELFQPRADGKFYISSIVNAPLDGSPPSVEVRGGLTKFSVLLLPTPEDMKLISLNFDAIEFIAKPNAKVDFSVQFEGFDFIGLLAFVNKLKDVIPMDGFKDPPFLDLEFDPHPGVRVGFTQGIPTVGIGIFTLQNINLGASFYLPFLGDGSLRLESVTHQPFILLYRNRRRGVCSRSTMV